jgi:hypothetical protein
MSKRGQLNSTEKQYLREHVYKLTAASIARHLNRGEEQIRNFIVNVVGAAPLGENQTGKDVKIQIKDDFRERVEWKQLEQAFTTEELAYFEQRYADLMNQFKGDVLATEDTQMIMLIKFELLMERNLRDRKRSYQDVEQLEKLIDKVYKNRDVDGDPEAQLLVQQLHAQLATARGATQAKTDEYVKLMAKHTDLMRELKGTRKERITVSEDNKIDIFSLLRSLQDAEVREQETMQLDIAKFAATEEKAKLSEFHEYADGSVDRPLLTPESVKDDSHD